MWLGKIAIILYVFAIGILFTGYYWDNVFGENLFSGATFEALDELANKNAVDQSISIDLIFGDFIAGVKVVFGILTGDTIYSALSLIPGFLSEWMLLTRITFTLSSALLWVYIVTGRSL